MAATLILTFLIMLAVVAGMSVGVLMNRRPIKGSCGGLSAEDGFDCACARAGEKPGSACSTAAP